MSEFVQYRRTQIAEMADWVPGFDMSGVSVSEADRKAGSPRAGDKIARNPANHEDRWLVAADYFAANFEALASAPQASRPPQGAELPLSVQFSADYLRAYMEGEPQEARRHLDKLIAALAASLPQASQPPQGAEPIIGHIQWSPGSEPSPELRATLQEMVTKAGAAIAAPPQGAFTGMREALQAFIDATAAGEENGIAGMASLERRVQFYDRIKAVRQKAVAALAAPPQGASSLLPGEQLVAAVFDNNGQFVSSRTLAASPLPAPQEPANRTDDEPLEWSGAVAFLTMAQNCADPNGPPWGDEFLAWYEPERWFGEHRACAIWLGMKFAGLAPAMCRIDGGKCGEGGYCANCPLPQARA